MCSFLVSTINITSGSLTISLIPPKFFSSLSRSAINLITSFLGSKLNSPTFSILLSLFNLSTLLRIVLKLVKVPPNQRELM